jgi:hypothetical protein
MASIVMKLAATKCRNAAHAFRSGHRPELEKLQDTLEVQKVREILQKYKNVHLEELLQELIAAQDGVRPQDVTVDYIQNQREKRFYPNTRNDGDSKYGGYNSRRLRFLSRNEFDAISEKVAAELASLD